MGHKKPFQINNSCANCKFSVPLSKTHYQFKWHKLVCKRFPPVGATSAPGDGPWSHESFVLDNDYCGEWKEE